MKVLALALFSILTLPSARATESKCEVQQGWTQIKFIFSGEDRNLVSRPLVSIPKSLIGRTAAITFDHPIDGEQILIGTVLEIPHVANDWREGPGVKGKFVLETEKGLAKFNGLVFKKFWVKPLNESFTKQSPEVQKYKGWKKIDFHANIDDQPVVGYEFTSIPDYLIGRTGAFFFDDEFGGKTQTIIEGKILSIPIVYRDRGGEGIRGAFEVETANGVKKIQGLLFRQLRVQRNP